jgi:transposase InsO family protein
MMESFWSTLKRELIHRCRFATRAQARAALFEWIEVFYNRERCHSALGYQSLWTLKRNSTKPCLMRHPNAVHQIEARPAPFCHF